MMVRPQLRMLAVLAILIGSASTVAGQAPVALVSSSMSLDHAGYHARETGNGEMLAVEISFHIEYQYEEGAVATDSTEIHAGVVEAPEGFAVSLDQSELQADVDPEGGYFAEELRVTLVPSEEVAEDGSEVAEFGIVKLAAEAERNGNVESASAEAHQLVPLRNASRAEDDRDARPATASAAGASGAGTGALVATGLIGGLAGAGAGALVSRRFL